MNNVFSHARIDGRASGATGFSGMESLENRQLLSVDLPYLNSDLAAKGDWAAAALQVPAKAAKKGSATASGKGREPRGDASGRPVIRRSTLDQNEIRTIIAQAASQARDGQVVAVVDREGFILAIFGVGDDIAPRTIEKAVMRARTAAFFQSRGDAFTPRTARFIIQDRFPFPVPNTVGGPLYGVQFSSLLGSDVLLPEQRLALTGDPGGIPLYKKGAPVGGVGVAGDFKDVAARKEFKLFSDEVDPYNVEGRVYTGGDKGEENDFDEAVALAGAQGFMAPELIRATNIFVDGLRFPFTKDRPATGRPNRSFEQIVNAGDGQLLAYDPLRKFDPSITNPPPETHPTRRFAGEPGHIMNPIVESNDSGEHLTAEDVKKIIGQAVKTALETRALIRQPLGVPAKVHVAVTDKDGDIIGVFRMEDGTRFSYDVAVQKARTAAFFSDDRHAFSTRAVGFMSQGFFPPAIEEENPGPLFRLQNELSSPLNLRGKLKNGITIFPGGVPLYKNGKLVGALGISGDGVDQDDIIAFGGSKGYRPAEKIRSDFLNDEQIVDFIRGKVREIDRDFVISQKRINIINDRLDEGLFGVRLPYVKFGRNPNL